MPFLYFYYITSSFLTVLAMVVFVSSLFSCFLPVSRWGKTSSSIWRKIQFFSWFFHLVMTWFSYCFSVTELTMQTVLPSDKSLAFYYLWNLVSKFVTTLSWKHRSWQMEQTGIFFVRCSSWILRMLHWFCILALEGQGLTGWRMIWRTSTVKDFPQGFDYIITKWSNTCEYLILYRPPALWSSTIHTVYNMIYADWGHLLPEQKAEWL